MSTVEPLKILVDRCISKRAMMHLRIAEFDIVHLSDFVGETQAQKLQDIDLFELAVKNNMVLFTADKNIRKNKLERIEIIEKQLKVFALPKNNYVSEVQAQYFINNKFRIIQKAKRKGPCFYTVRKNDLSKNLLGENKEH